jgi:hypothetical protein
MLSRVVGCKQSVHGHAATPPKCAWNMYTNIEGPFLYPTFAFKASLNFRKIIEVYFTAATYALVIGWYFPTAIAKTC